MSKKLSSAEQFAKNPEKYRDDKVFATGEDLQYMKDAVGFPRIQTLLDIGTGAGHTAIAFADIAEKCVGIDITEEMVEVAKQFASDNGVSNIHFQVGDVGNLPFADESFCVVTCRLAAHHFPQIEKAMQEIARVLKPGGVFLLVDHYAPEDKVLDTFINQIDQTRDPSHVREYTLSEWSTFFSQNSLTYEEIKKWDLPLHFPTWVERSQTPEEAIIQLQSIFQHASKEIHETFHVTFQEDGNINTFALKSVLLRGIKQ